MSAYVVFTRERMRDKSGFDQYSTMVPATMAGHDGKVLVAYGNSVTLEGAPIEGCVVVEFESMDAAKAWYESTAYREAREHRFKAADYRVFITEGV